MYKNFMHLVLLARILSSVFQMVPSIVGSRCLYFPFGVLTVNFTSSFIYLVVAAQVFVTKRIQDLKQALFQDAIKSDSATIQVPVSIKVLKFVTSKWVAIALYLVFIGAIVGIHLLLYFVVARQSCQEFTMYIRVSVVIVSALLLSMIILVLLLDLYESREDCFQLKCWKLYTHDDPLVYRTELTLIIMLIPFLVVLSLIVTNVPAIPTELGTSSVKLLADFLSFIFIPGVSFFATIWSECKLARASKMKRESRKSLTFFNPSEETIRMLLADPVLAKHFIAFAKREYAIFQHCTNILDSPLRIFSSLRVYNNSRQSPPMKMPKRFTICTWIRTLCWNAISQMVQSKACYLH